MSLASAPALPASDPEPKAFGKTFWMLNTIEMFERLAFYTLRVMAPIYIMQADDPGGLHLTPQQKGIIYAWWAIFQSILPMATGGFADRYGYKRTMTFSITLMLIGYVMVAIWRDVVWLGPIHGDDGKVLVSALDNSNYWSLFISIMTLATGTAFFKPSIQGSLAQNLTKANSSIGWGVFYWVVNVGAFVGHYIPGVVFVIMGSHSAEAWRYLFLLSAVFMSLNYLVLFTFRDVPTGARKDVGILDVLGQTISNIWPYWLVGGRFHPIRGSLGFATVGAGIVLLILKAIYPAWDLWDRWPGQVWQLTLLLVAFILAGVLLTTWLEGGVFTWQLRLPAWLLIMSGFWMMMYQLWDLQPNFIADWIDSRPMAEAIHASLPATLASAFVEETPRGLQIPQQVILSINAMCIIIGVLGVAWLTRKMRTLSAMLIGMLMATAGVLVAGLTMDPWMLVLGIVCFSLGEMATGPKKNEYLGLIAPPGKKGLYLGYVNIPVGIGVFAGSWIAGEVYGRFGEKATLALRMVAEKTGLQWSGDVKTMESALGIKRTEALAKLQELTGLDATAATRLLWDTYDPQFHVWLPFAAIGIVSAIALAIFGQMAKRWKDMNA